MFENKADNINAENAMRLKYKEFLKITKLLNKELNIIPILYGSLGLSILIQKNLHPKDIDILVPKIYIDKKFPKLIKILSQAKYKLINEKEHEFKYLKNKVGISFEEDLLTFAKINYKKLKIISDHDIYYKILNIKQYQKVYQKSQKDSYRISKNNNDAYKIKVIAGYLKTKKSLK